MGKTSRDKRDIYYRCAKMGGNHSKPNTSKDPSSVATESEQAQNMTEYSYYRARSAYKLLQIDKQFNIFEGVQRVVDLCGAPGSWSQVIIERMKQINPDIDFHECHRVINVDLQTVAPIDGVKIIKGDITRQSTVDEVLEIFEGHKVELIVSDGAPDVTGNHEFDQYLQHQLVLAAINISFHLMKEGGTFVAKVFRGKDFIYLTKFLKRLFKSVIISKPKCCRNSSIEGFIVCRGFHREDQEIVISETLNALDLIDGLNFVQQNKQEYYSLNQPAVVSLDSILEQEDTTEESKIEEDDTGDNHIEFVSCGDPSSLDPDMNYPLNFDVNTGKVDETKTVEDYQYLKPFPKIVD
ncbi:unnamed protein product [Moneuplotes crassus]|uniref:Ribosomal RNA methyltransferase FtsJ domain-containing protein n=2 Tax=Euplotes crassus TaxID=5936 RepID=A0AAD1XL90_EUPCR|nr:unnamed protein product [Moneuplotes crassus]